MIGNIEQPKQSEQPIEQGSVGIEQKPANIPSAPAAPQPPAEDMLPTADQVLTKIEPASPKSEPWPLPPPVTLEQLESALKHLSDDPDVATIGTITNQYNALRQNVQKPTDLQ